MLFEQEKTTEKQLIPTPPARRRGRCLACGTEGIKPGRRYCSKECRQKLVWTLSLSKGLLQTLNTRYAAFSFTELDVALDVIPSWSKQISRFVYARERGHPPANALKELVLKAGEEWYQRRRRRISYSFAAQSILEEKAQRHIDPDSIRPNPNKTPRLSAEQKKALKNLNIPFEQLVFGDYTREIKRAYREMAKEYHPDRGGDGERFKEINRAHECMLQWVEEPQYQSSTALPGCWSYDGYKNRWAPPLFL